MAEYIEREAAIAAAFSATPLGNSAFRDVNDTVSRLRLIPAAVVRPVVLCKDCKYFNCQDSTTDGKSRCDREQLYQPVSYRPYRKRDDFCYYGEKRKES